MTLWLLFVSAFISSTIFPGGSEAVLSYIATDSIYPIYLLVVVATLGNTLGSMTSWGLGLLISLRYSTKKLSKQSHLEAVQKIQKYGSPILLLAWLPVIGDPLCVAAGWLRIHWLPSLLFISIGKLIRYIIVIYVFT